MVPKDHADIGLVHHPAQQGNPAVVVAVNDIAQDDELISFRETCQVKKAEQSREGKTVQVRSDIDQRVFSSC
ncbi:MAG: hypothetical protein IJL88_03925, partial [Clostridia bacterium]|nr:hypothetical protein [Clostridia bacterium]